MAKSFFQRVGNVVKNIIAVIILAVVTVVFFTPVLFYFWALIVPRTMADFLAGDEFPVYTEIVRTINKWQIALLPFWAKKHFMSAMGLGKFSPKDQLSYYREVESSATVIRKMSEGGVMYLWDKGTYSERSAFIAHSGRSLNDERVIDLIIKNDRENIVAYIRKWTPSANIIKVLFDRGFNDEAIIAVKRYGLSNDLIKYVYKTADKELIARVQSALTAYSQRKIVLQTSVLSPEWETFCSTTESIAPWAQVVMDPDQYEVFNRTGHRLDKAVVESIFSSSDIEMGKKIIELEPNHGMVSPLAESLINGNAELSLFLVHVLGKKND